MTGTIIRLMGRVERNINGLTRANSFESPPTWVLDMVVYSWRLLFVGIASFGRSFDVSAGWLNRSSRSVDIARSENTTGSKSKEVNQVVAYPSR